MHIFIISFPVSRRVLLVQSARTAYLAMCWTIRALLAPDLAPTLVVPVARVLRCGLGHRDASRYLIYNITDLWC